MCLKHDFGLIIGEKSDYFIPFCENTIKSFLGYPVCSHLMTYLYMLYLIFLPRDALDIALQFLYFISCNKTLKINSCGFIRNIINLLEISLNLKICILILWDFGFLSHNIIFIRFLEIYIIHMQHVWPFLHDYFGLDLCSLVAFFWGTFNQ